MDCFLYARKSTESEDRQILSIESQINELKAVALKQGLKIVEIFSEAKSAKAPGRPIFNKMMKSVFQSGGINILCWKLDRLARNPVDGGSLIWAVEQKKLTRIFTPSRDFKNSGDDKFWMQLEFGIAKKYVDDLSDNVKRGLRAKLDKGILPGKAPVGYLNDRETKTIVKDPNRFSIVRRIWDIVLSGDYNVETLLKAAENDWGLITRQSKRNGGKALTRSGLYKLLDNPFYYGAIKRKGDLYPGIHEPMITKDEFDKVQRILGRPNTCPKTKSFAFTGLIRCGECGSMITAEDKINRYGYRYTYYHCTRRKGGIKNTCRQKYIEVEELENQVLSFLEKLHLPQTCIEWTFKYIREAKEDEEKLQADIKISLEKALANCKRKLDNLLDLRLKELLTDEEYLSEKAKLTEKKMNLQAQVAALTDNPNKWLEPFQKFFSFVNLAENSFENGNAALKRQILSTIGSNLFLKDKILLIEAKKPFRLIIENGHSSLGCRERDSNPHGLCSQRILSPSCIPISPSRPVRSNG